MEYLEADVATVSLHGRLSLTEILNSHISLGKLLVQT